MKCRYFCRLPLDISPVYLTRGISACVLSALRLCVWLSNNGYIQLRYMNERFLFTFWTEQGEIP